MRAKFIAATAAVLMSTASAYASPITFSTPINVPNTFDGLYINLLTGATGTTGGSVAGWDFNPYNSGTSLSFFWSASPSQASGVASTTTGPYTALAAGAVVSSASTFAQVTGSTATSAFQAAGTHILGFRFYNESTSAINYGYMTLVSGGATGFPLTISGWTFENSGGAITVPGATAGVPEPTTWALMIMGFGAMGAAMRRNRAVTPRVRYA